MACKGRCPRVILIPLNRVNQDLPLEIKSFLKETFEFLRGETFSYESIRSLLWAKMPHEDQLRYAKQGHLLKEETLPRELKGMLAKPPRGLEWLIFNRNALHFLFPKVLPEPPPKGQITDVYILSHRHRNFFGGWRILFQRSFSTPSLIAGDELAAAISRSNDI